MKALPLIFALFFALGCSPKNHGGERTPSDDQYCPEKTPQAFALIDHDAATKAGCAQVRVHQASTDPTTAKPTHNELAVWCCPSR